MMIVDSGEKYAWCNWIYHFLNIRNWTRNDKVVQEFKKLPPIVFARWMNNIASLISSSDHVKDLRGAIDRFNTLKSCLIDQVFWTY